MRADFIHDPNGLVNWNKVLGNTVNVLWLRRPIDRIISQHAMVSRWTDEECGAVGSENWRMRELAREGFGAFMNCDSLPAHRARFNGITGFLQLGDPSAASLWENARFAGHEKSRRKAVEIALRNLQEMHFIGFVETFPESFEAMTRMIGWPSNEQPVSMNVFHSTRTELSEEDLALAKFDTELDDEIYAAALKLMEERQANGLPLRMATPNRFHQERIGPRSSAIAHAGGSEFIDGWYSCERNGDKLSRWSGPSPRSRIALHVEKSRDLFIRARVSQARSMDQLNQLTCTIDGKPVVLTPRIVGPHDIVFEGSIKASKLDRAEDLLWIMFDCGETESAADPKDVRNLGLEFCEVEVGPNENYSAASLALLPYKQ